MRYDVFAVVLGSIGLLLIWWGSDIQFDGSKVSYTVGPGAPLLLAAFGFSLVAIYKAFRRT